MSAAPLPQTAESEDFGATGSLDAELAAVTLPVLLAESGSATFLHASAPSAQQTAHATLKVVRRTTERTARDRIVEILETMWCGGMYATDVRQIQRGRARRKSCADTTVVLIFAWPQMPGQAQIPLEFERRQRASRDTPRR